MHMHRSACTALHCRVEELATPQPQQIWECTAQQQVSVDRWLCVDRLVVKGPMLQQRLCVAAKPCAIPEMH
jgi:hypothetical protein